LGTSSAPWNDDDAPPPPETMVAPSSMMAWPAGRGPEALCVRSARVVVDELVERLRLRARVLQHPQQVLEQHDLADDDGARHSPGGAGAAAGAVDEGLEQQVAHELLGDEVTVVRLADLHRVQALGHIHAVERRRAAVLVAGDDGPIVAVVAGRWRAGDAAGRVPPPEHRGVARAPGLRGGHDDGEVSDHGGDADGQRVEPRK